MPRPTPAEHDRALRRWKTKQVANEVRAERARQDTLFGEQNHPDGTGKAYDIELRDAKRVLCDTAFKHGDGSWRYILEEEVAEAYAETDPVKLRAELIQVAAVAAAWVEAIDRRTA